MNSLFLTIYQDNQQMSSFLLLHTCWQIFAGRLPQSEHWNVNGCIGSEVSEKRVTVFRADDQRYLQQERPAST